MGRVYVLLGLLSLCAMARAEDACPWLTQGTAATFMGGDVGASVHVSAGEGTCEFTRVSGGDRVGSVGAGMRMRVAIGHLPPKECVTGERLTGIGQDAVFCKIDTEGEHREIIRARVRATYFVLTVSEKETSGAAKMTRSILEQVAEEVAGNLF